MGADARGLGGEVRVNYHIAPGEEIAPRGQIAKIKANLRALKLLKNLQKEGRAATPDEQRILVQYTGWGHSPQVFDRQNASYWERGLTYISGVETWAEKYYEYYKELKELLTEDEWETAADSTLNAHYTSKEVITAMWDLARHLGFTGGTVLEPAAGIGHFFGLMPEDLTHDSSLVGVELDQISGGILAQLYPNANILVKGFEDVPIPPNSVDLAITNVPFAKEGPADAQERYGQALNLHNYFLARMVDAVKPGGIVLAISSHHSMDSFRKQRQVIADRADFLGAVRLPNNAFEENAGTPVGCESKFI